MKATPEDVAKAKLDVPDLVESLRASMKATPEDVAKSGASAVMSNDSLPQ